MATEKPLTEKTIKLGHAVYAYIEKANEEENGHLDKVIKEMMAASLAVFVENATSKFIKGQREHGGLITDRDLDVEIRNELLDLFWYLQAQDWQYRRLVNEKQNQNKEKDKG